MACPTCDHTMQNACGGEHVQLFWCPRCGTTMLNPSYGDVVISVPKLVARVVEFGKLLAQEDEDYLIDEFERMGIDESISRG